MISEVARHHPHIIFVHMGENDLGRRTANQIVRDLLDFVNRLARRCRSHVIVGQLIYFPANQHLTDGSGPLSQRSRVDWTGYKL